MVEEKVYRIWTRLLPKLSKSNHFNEIFGSKYVMGTVEQIWGYIKDLIFREKKTKMEGST